MLHICHNYHINIVFWNKNSVLTFLHRWSLRYFLHLSAHLDVLANLDLLAYFDLIPEFLIMQINIY